MDNPNDLTLLGGWISRDTVGNAGIALMTLLASAGGFFFSSWLGRGQALKDLKRQKLEELCMHMHNAVFYINEALRKVPFHQRFTPKAVLNNVDGIEHMEQADRALSMAFTIERLYFPGLFGRPHYKIMSPRLVSGITDPFGMRAYEIKQLDELLGVLNDLNRIILEKFKEFI